MKGPRKALLPCLWKMGKVILELDLEGGFTT